ncbi:hypothetical protein M405DRAFT_160325 [Rhizopogon salebrosus TDB-379]|nr:hypothetical protein M405DRAFT_160325 [Rhizopogon salebrosus TDB-379]
MRETHPYRPTYDIIGGQGMGESQDDMHRISSSFVSSAFALPHLAAAPGSPRSHARTSSGSAFYENVSVSNDGYASSGEGSGSTERDFASAQSLYTSNDRQSSISVGVGIAIGSESSMDLHPYRTAATTLAPAIQTHLDDDDELESPGPSPSSFPTPPSSNPFLNTARIVDYPELVASRASHSRAVLTLSEPVALAPTRTFTEKQTSWAAAVAAASPTDAQTPKATRSLNPFTDAGYVVDVSSDSSSEDIKMPTRSGPLLMPSNNSSFVVNPFLRQASQEGFSDDSRSTESHETVTIPYAYSDPFASRDKGNGKAHLSADLMDDTKRNRLSNASSGLELPENPSQCGIAL